MQLTASRGDASLSITNAFPLQFRLAIASNDEGRDIFVVDAHRDDGKRFVVHSDEKLTAFLETEKVTRSTIVNAIHTPNATA